MKIERFDPVSIEKKWREKWEKEKAFKVDVKSAKKPFYNLMMFPYPSGEGLHVGHVYAFGGADTYGRYKRMRGLDVFEPMGFDSFGIHSENYAIKIGKHPRQLIEETTTYFRGEQLKRLGALFNWDHQVITSDPKYYKWTQWLFIQLFKAGLAVRKKAPVDWCPSCKTVLADEQVVAGKCERCSSQVIQEQLEQWFFKITDYAERLLKNLEKIDWSETTKQMQRNWIGRSEGTEIEFPIKGSKESLKVYTTRPDTVYGATFMVIAPEHKLAEKIAIAKQSGAVRKYIEDSKKVSEIERSKAKSGVFTGSYAINPFTKKEIPIWIADYVLMGYGTGAIMAVPAHDQRDFEFAKKYGLGIKSVIAGPKNKTALILHGTSGDNEKAWIPWLSNELEFSGYQVFAPNLPDSDLPEFNKWQATLDRYYQKTNQDSVIVGHSLGAPTAVQFVLKNSKKIDKLLLVAPTFPEMDWTSYKKKHSDKNSANIENLTLHLKNWDKLRSLVSDLIIFYSEDDGYIPVFEVETKLKKKLPWAKFKKFEKKSHFNHSAKIFELPEAVNELLSQAYTSEGSLVNSGEFDGLNSKDAVGKFVDYVEKEGLGKKTVNYHLRDWLISRQRYWGPPIPMIYCEACARGGKSWFTTKEANDRFKKDETNHKTDILNPTSDMNGWYPVPEEDLPVELPYVKDYQPKGSGLSPLAQDPSFVRVNCPGCGKDAKRETDVSDTFLDSAWYFLRYPSTDSKDEAFDQKVTKKWLPVDSYIGGNEHAVMHLLYTRFITMALNDMGHIDFEEPFKKFRAHGLIIHKGAKMSKSRGNVVNPNEYLDAYGADSLRMYLLFIGPYDLGGEFSDRAIIGVYKYLNRVWHTSLEISSSPSKSANKEVAKEINKLIKKISLDVDDLRFNTAIAAMMEFLNFIAKEKKSIDIETLKKYIVLLSIFAPHAAEELWSKIAKKGSVHSQDWPTVEESALKEEETTIAVQINGKFRDSLRIQNSEAKVQNNVEAKAKESEKVDNHLKGKKIKQVIYVPGKIINFVTD